MTGTWNAPETCTSSSPKRRLNATCAAGSRPGPESKLPRARECNENERETSRDRGDARSIPVMRAPRVSPVGVKIGIMRRSLAQRRVPRYSARVRCMARLSVNLNKVALLRNSRRTGVPDLLHFARIALDAGRRG